MIKILPISNKLSISNFFETIYTETSLKTKNNLFVLGNPNFFECFVIYVD